MIKAVIYDVDGTIVDSEPLHVKAWDIALQFYNHHLTDLSESFRATMAGKKPANIAKEMTDELSLQIDSQNLLQKKTEIFMNLIKTDLQPMPGLKKSIENLKHDGYKLGIGTSQMKDYIYLVLDTLHIFEFFDVVVTGELPSYSISLHNFL